MASNDQNAEMTVRAVILGVVLSVILAGANAYLGLFAGMTVSASIPAAVISMGVLGLLGHGGLRENNLVQTSASAGESLAAGVIFTLPALVILNFWQDFDFLWVTLIAGFGGVLGVLFTIPLRRSLILDAKLKFPEGIATAEVLRSGERGGRDIRFIAQAGVVGAVFKFCETGIRAWLPAFEWGGRFGNGIVYLGANLSPALISVGYIVGFNIAVLILLGGVFNWYLAIPLYAMLNPAEWPVGEDGTALGAVDGAMAIWSAKTRYIGVGGMLIGGLWTVFRIRSSLFGGFAAGFAAYRHRQNGGPEIAREERDIPMQWVAALIVMSVVPLFIVYQVFVQNLAVSLPMAVIMLVMGFLFSAVAGYMAGLVGSSNNPVSGVTIATILISSLLLLVLMGAGAENGPAAAIIIGSVVCCAAAIAGDNMQDLKAGQLVGATPWKQQVMQMVGTATSALVMAPILMLLLKAYGFAGHESATDAALAAPQANLMASVAQGVFHGGIPWGFVTIGMVLAAVVIAVDVWLESTNRAFRAPVLAVAIGVYLPISLATPIFLGGVISALIAWGYRRRKTPEAVREVGGRHGLLFASGLITGEALVGILMAIPIVISGKPDVLALLNNPLGPWPGMILLAVVGVWLYQVGSARWSGAEE